jgi:uncharacterized protein (DUF433 family)
MATTRVHKRQPANSHEENGALIEQDPYSPGRHNARLTESGTHVWAIIAYLQATNWNIAEVARDYAVSEASIRAAIEYYEAHRNLIDADLLLRDEEQNAP